MTMNGWMKLAAALFAAGAFAGWSLLKVAVATGDPLSKEQMNVRTMTRGFYYDMAGEVARAADSIVAASPDVNVRVAAVRWKIRATRAGVTAAMQGIPDVALADLWILCRRMNEGFAQAPDSLLFGLQSDIARDAVYANIQPFRGEQTAVLKCDRRVYERQPVRAVGHRFGKCLRRCSGSDDRLDGRKYLRIIVRGCGNRRGGRAERRAEIEISAENEHQNQHKQQKEIEFSHKTPLEEAEFSPISYHARIDLSIYNRFFREEDCDMLIFYRDLI